jgi:hypothetical protein
MEGEYILDANRRIAKRMARLEHMQEAIAYSDEALTHGLTPQQYAAKQRAERTGND